MITISSMLKKIIYSNFLLALFVIMVGCAFKKDGSQQVSQNYSNEENLQINLSTQNYGLTGANTGTASGALRDVVVTLSGCTVATDNAQMNLSTATIVWHNNCTFTFNSIFVGTGGGSQSFANANSNNVLNASSPNPTTILFASGYELLITTSNLYNATSFGFPTLNITLRNTSASAQSSNATQLATFTSIWLSTNTSGCGGTRFWGALSGSDVTFKVPTSTQTYYVCYTLSNAATVWVNGSTISNGTNAYNASQPGYAVVGTADGNWVNYNLSVLFPGTCLYAANFDGKTVSMYRVVTGTGSLRSTAGGAASTATTVTTTGNAEWITTHPNMPYVYVLHDNAKRVNLYYMNSNCSLNYVDFYLTNGVTNAEYGGFTLDPPGNYLYVGSRAMAGINGFRVSSSTGILTNLNIVDNYAYGVSTLVSYNFLGNVYVNALRQGDGIGPMHYSQNPANGSLTYVNYGNSNNGALSVNGLIKNPVYDYVTTFVNYYYNSYKFGIYAAGTSSYIGTTNANASGWNSAIAVQYNGWPIAQAYSRNGNFYYWFTEGNLLEIWTATSSPSTSGTILGNVYTGMHKPGTCYYCFPRLTNIATHPSGNFIYLPNDNAMAVSIYNSSSSTGLLTVPSYVNNTSTSELYLNATPYTMTFN